MWPKAEGCPWPAGLELPSHWIVFDLVYNPIRTRLFERALAAGALIVDGLEMLVYQGALAFELWTDQQAPVALMRRAALEALKYAG